MKSGIYKILNKINNHCYIGSAVNIKSRFATHKNHLKNNKHHSLYLQRAWNKYGEESFEFIILKECNKENLLEAEQSYFDEINPEYNICKVAGSCLHVKFSEESNRKKSLNHSRKGKFGKDHNSSKKIYQYDLNGNFLKIWYGGAEIERVLGFSAPNIRLGIKRNLTPYGYFWSYKYLGKIYKEVPKRKNRDKTKKPIQQFTLNGEFIKNWNSAKEATTFLNKRDGSLSSCLKKRNKKAYGYIWKYKKE